MIATLLLASTLAAAPAPLDAGALRARYGDLSALTAEITQVKEGRYWARPMRSRVALRWTPKRIEWETKAPVRSLLVIEGETLTLTDARGKARAMGGAGDPRVQALVTLLKAFLSLDLPAIERQYELRYEDTELLARLRPEATVRVFQALRFAFDEKLDLRELELTSEGERTVLTFDRLAREAGSRKGP